jgi:hypothetical protein
MTDAREHRIHNFIGNFIAFHRPRKNTYCLIHWAADLNCWTIANIQPNAGIIKIYKSGLHGTTSFVRICLHNNLYVEIKSIGKYLRIGELDVPIVARVSGSSIPMRIVNNDFGGVIRGEPYLRDVELWTLPPAVETAAARDTPAHLAYIIKPLPKRVAWILAEDAQKNEDTCAITMDQINPISAAVTTCFHCFDHESIQTWMESNTTCPQCREPCKVTRAFEA